MSSASGSAPTFIHLHAQDSVVVALKELPQGTKIQVAGTEISLRQTIPPGHKIAIKTLEPDESIWKFGWPIGLTKCRVEAGEHVHSHNLRCDHTIDLDAIATEIPPSPNR